MLSADEYTRLLGKAGIQIDPQNQVQCDIDTMRLLCRVLTNMLSGIYGEDVVFAIADDVSLPRGFAPFVDSNTHLVVLDQTQSGSWVAGYLHREDEQICLFDPVANNLQDHPDRDAGRAARFEGARIKLERAEYLGVFNADEDGDVWVVWDERVISTTDEFSSASICLAWGEAIVCYELKKAYARRMRDSAATPAEWDRWEQLDITWSNGELPMVGYNHEVWTPWGNEAEIWDMPDPSGPNTPWHEILWLRLCEGHWLSQDDVVGDFVPQMPITNLDRAVARFAKASLQVSPAYGEQCDAETMDVLCGCLNEKYAAQNVVFLVLCKERLPDGLRSIPTDEYTTIYVFYEHESVWTAACIARQAGRVVELDIFDGIAPSRAELRRDATRQARIQSLRHELLTVRQFTNPSTGARDQAFMDTLCPRGYDLALNIDNYFTHAAECHSGVDCIAWAEGLFNGWTFRPAHKQPRGRARRWVARAARIEPWPRSFSAKGQEWHKVLNARIRQRAQAALARAD